MAFEQAEEQEITMRASEPTASDGVYEVGKVIAGKFEILSLIGSGGMSTVYKAQHRLLNKVVALKVLQANRLDEKAVQRFKVEAQAASSLSHPNIASVREFGLDENSHPYIVMDFIDAVPLSQLIQEHSLSPTRALQIARGICMGLEHAHERGIVHRDIKPDNILIVKNADGTDQPLIVDFGIARTNIDDESRTRLTQTGEVFGTPSYMSPEQALGYPVDRRSDIYSLGCVLYEMISGQKPFTADNPLALLMKHTSEPPAPLKDVPAEMQTVVMKAMEKDPIIRYATAADMHSAIENIFSDNQALSMPELSYAKTLVLRACAWLIDLALVSVPGWLIACLLPGGLTISPNRTLSLAGLAEQCMPSFGVTQVVNQDGSVSLIAITFLICIGNYLYHASFESSRKQATLGKQIVGLIVTNNGFGRLTFREASYRHWSKVIYFAMYFMILTIGWKGFSITEWPPVALFSVGTIAAVAFFLRKRYQMMHDIVGGAKVIPGAYGRQPENAKEDGKADPSRRRSSVFSTVWRTLVTFLCAGLVAWGISTDVYQMNLMNARSLLAKLTEDALHIDSLPRARQISEQATKELRQRFPLSIQAVGDNMMESANRMLSQDKFQDAEKTFEMGVQLCDQPLDQDTMGRMVGYFNNECLNKRRRHDYNGAEKAGLRALELVSTMANQPDRPAGFNDLQYGSFVRLGWLYNDLKLSIKALDIFNKALESDAVKNDDVRKAMLRLDIGGVYLPDGKLDLAEEQFKMSLAAAEKAGDKYLQGVALAMIANCENGKKNLSAAHDLCVRAKELMSNQPQNSDSWYQSRYRPFYGNLAKAILKENKVDIK